MRSFDEIKHLPQFPGIYGFKKPNNIQDNYSYIGLSNKLRESVSQNLLKGTVVLPQAQVLYH